MFGFASAISKSLRNLGLGVAVLAAASPAFSQSARSTIKIQGDGEVSMAVSYQDLDLTTEAGGKELQHRVRVAAQRVCTEEPDLWVIAMTTPRWEIIAAASAADMQRRAIAAARARSYATTPADKVTVAAVAEGH
jgi:UrcA family protein